MNDTHEISHDLLLEIYAQSDPETRAKISAQVEAMIPSYTGIKTLDDARSYVADTIISPHVRKHHNIRTNILTELSYLHMAITDCFIPDWQNTLQEKWAIVLKDYALTGASENVDTGLSRPYGLVQCTDWHGPEATMFPLFFPSAATANHFMDVSFDLILKYYMP